MLTSILPHLDPSQPCVVEVVEETWLSERGKSSLVSTAASLNPASIHHNFSQHLVSNKIIKLGNKIVGEDQESIILIYKTWLKRKGKQPVSDTTTPP